MKDLDSLKPYQVLKIYCKLSAKEYRSTDEIIKDIRKNDSFFILAKDYAEKLLKRTANWSWLTNGVLDDLHPEAVRMMQKKVVKWDWDAKYEKGSMSKSISSTYKLCKWLFVRYVSELKNLFDERSKNYIDIKKVQRTLIQAAKEHTSVV